MRIKKNYVHVSVETRRTIHTVMNIKLTSYLQDTSKGKVQGKLQIAKVRKFKYIYKRRDFCISLLLPTTVTKTLHGKVIPNDFKYTRCSSSPSRVNMSLHPQALPALCSFIQIVQYQKSPTPSDRELYQPSTSLLFNKGNDGYSATKTRPNTKTSTVLFLTKRLIFNQQRRFNSSRLEEENAVVVNG